MVIKKMVAAMRCPGFRGGIAAAILYNLIYLIYLYELSNFIQWVCRCEL